MPDLVKKWLLTHFTDEKFETHTTGTLATKIQGHAADEDR